MNKEIADHNLETPKFKEIVMQSKDIIYYCLVKPKPQVLFVNGLSREHFRKDTFSEMLDQMLDCSIV